MLKNQQSNIISRYVAAPQVEYSGGGVGRTARCGRVSSDVLLGIGGIQREVCIGDEDWTGRAGGNLRTCRDDNGQSAVDGTERAAAGHIELEVVVVLRDARHLHTEAVDTEDFPEEIKIVAGGVVNQGFTKVQELVGLHRAELVADDIAESPRLAARCGLGDAGLS